MRDLFHFKFYIYKVADRIEVYDPHLFTIEKIWVNLLDQNYEISRINRKKKTIDWLKTLIGRSHYLHVAMVWTESHFIPKST